MLEQRDLTSRHRWLALCVLCISMIVIALDVTIVNVAAPTLAVDLHSSVNQLQWILDAYILAFAVLLLTCGHFVDRVGRKTGLITGLAVFGLGSFLATLASGPAELISARAFIGVGAALIMPSTLSSISHIFRIPGERARALSLWSATSALGAVLGPIVGGKLLQQHSWQSVFWINVPIVTVGIIMAIPFVPNSKHQGARADFVGLILSAIGLVSLVWAIIEGPIKGWSSAPILWAFILAGVALAVFGVWELARPHPLVPMRFFRNLRFSMASLSISTAYFSLMGGLFLSSQYVQTVLGNDAYHTGLKLLPEAIAIGLFAAASNVLSHHIGTKLVVGCGLLIATASLFMFAHTTTGWTYTDLLITIIGLGAGLGMTMSPCMESVIGSLPQSQTGIGSAVNSTMIQVGSALGVAVFGSLENTPFHHEMIAKVQQLHLPSQIGQTVEKSIVGSTLVAQQMGGTTGPTILSAAKHAFLHGMDNAMLIGGFATLAAAIVALVFLPAWGRPVATESEPLEPEPLEPEPGTMLSSPLPR